MHIINHEQLSSWSNVGHGHDLGESVRSELTNLVGVLLKVVLADIVHGGLDGGENLKVSVRERKADEPSRLPSRIVRSSSLGFLPLHVLVLRVLGLELERRVLFHLLGDNFLESWASAGPRHRQLDLRSEQLTLPLNPSFLKASMSMKVSF